MACHEESLALCREFDSRHIISSSLHNLGFVALEHGDDVRAMAYFSESLEIARQQSDPEEIGGSLAGLAGVAAARGQFERAARLFGAMDARALRTFQACIQPINSCATAASPPPAPNSATAPSPLPGLPARLCRSNRPSPRHWTAETLKGLRARNEGGLSGLSPLSASAVRTPSE